MRRLVIFLIISTVMISELRAQNIQRVIKGEIRSSTGEPISYATIAVNQTLSLSDSRGLFSLNLKSASSQDTVFFSCVGFESVKLVVSTVEANPMITLKQRSLVLNEVFISAKGRFQTAQLGNTGSNFFNKFLSRVNDQYALFIENAGGHSGVIRSVSYFVKEPPGGSHDGAFRVRIYGVNKVNGGPDQDLLFDNLIVHAKKKNAWFNVDVSRYQIKMPQDGVFIAMEILPGDQYKTGSTRNAGAYINNLKMPCLGLNYALNKPSSWLKNDFSRGGRDWRLFNAQEVKPSNLMININVQLQ